MGRRPKDILVDKEPQPMPDVQAKVLDTSVIVNLGNEAVRIISENAAERSVTETIEALYQAYESRYKAPEKVLYVTDMYSLNLFIDVLRYDKDGKPILQQTLVEFRRGKFETDDLFLIKALEIHPSYGGEGDKYATTSREPLFWRSSFPRWKYEMIAAREAELSPVPREE